MADSKPAKVSLTRITIDAPPQKVYAKLAAIKAWNEWNKGHWVLHAPGQELLGVGDKFSYTAPFVLGNVQAEVQDAAEAKALEWRDKALFGLVGGGHSWRLQSKGKKLLGLIGSTQTQVTLDHEITGLGQLFVSEKSMERHGVSWMLALKAAVEGKT